MHAIAAAALATVLGSVGPAAADPSRLLRAGVELNAGERLRTDDANGVYLLFPDGSGLSVGPGAELVLDEFARDGGGGRIVLSASRGVFRFVSGAIGKAGEVEIRTPLASIGIEGGVALIEVGETVSAALLFGRALTVTDTRGGAERAIRPGAEISVTREGGVAPPAPISEAMLANLARLEAGDAPAAPAVEDEDIAASQFAEANSLGLLGEIAPAAGEAPAPLPAPQIGHVPAEASQEQARIASTLACVQDAGDCAGDDAPNGQGGAGSTGSPGGAGSTDSPDGPGSGNGGSAGAIFGFIVNPGLVVFPPVAVGGFAFDGRPIHLVATPGAGRSSRTLNGFAAGLESRLEDGAYLGPQGLTSSDDPLDIAIVTSVEEDRISAVFKLAPSVAGDELTLRFDSAPPGYGVFVDDLSFVAWTENAFPGPPRIAPSAVTIIANPTLRERAALPDGVAFCECEYLLWGLFRGRLPPDEPVRRLEAGLWVAGELADFQSQLTGFPQQMTASYSGHVIAAVNNNGAFYGAVGGINLQFTFGGGAFTLDEVSITSFDGTNLQRTTPAALTFGANAYGTVDNFTVSGAHPTAGPITATLAGAFFGPGAPPHDTGGKVEFSGANYEAHGVYAASR